MISMYIEGTGAGMHLLTLYLYKIQMYDASVYHDALALNLEWQYDEADLM